MKLVELLARELKDWRIAAACATQEEGGDVFFWKSASLRCVSGDWKHDTGCGLIESNWSFKLNYLATDHATAIVTRADWEAERARIAKPGWIRHRGGKCPVEAGVLVMYRMRGGVDSTDVVTASRLRWNHNGISGDIMAYRVCEPAPLAEPEPAAEIYNAQPVDHGPLQWRDRINTIDFDIAAQNEAHRLAIETLEEERVSLVQQLAAEGLQLIGGVARAAEEWQRLALIDGKTVSAVKAHREANGSSLKVALDSVRAYAANNA